MAPAKIKHCANCGAVVPKGSSSRYCGKPCQQAHKAK